MLSILIPTYNYNCVPLVQEMCKQIAVAEVEAEVVVMDDASPCATVREANAAIAAMPRCRYIALEENIGIARIRNRLADESKGDYLLFLDADVYPVSERFVEQYMDACESADVVCGGLTMRQLSDATRNRTLRYRYSMRVEALTPQQRMHNPYGEFRTLNFLVSREAFEKTRFDETFVRYGHEDTLFGKELQQNGCTIAHIDNPIYHDVPDTNEEFLEKTRKSIDNLRDHRESLQSHVRLLAFYDKLQRLHMAGVVGCVVGWMFPLLKANLLSRHPSLTLLNVYKVGYICRVMRREA